MKRIFRWLILAGGAGCLSGALPAMASAEPQASVESLADTLAGSALPPAGWRISGHVRFSKPGPIYIAVVTAEQWRQGGKIPNELKLVPPAGMEKGGELPFEFNALPAGTYCIKAYQDVNQNGKLDFLIGPNEPVGMYRNARPAFRPPRFDEMAFALDKDLDPVTLELK